jgi:hypothetical protein
MAGIVALFERAKQHLRGSRRTHADNIGEKLSPLA